MAMSRRKQLHPKSKKDCDETLYVFPDELKCDEESHDIIARFDIEQGHRFGPFPAVLLASHPDLPFVESDAANTNNAISAIQIDNTTINRQIQSFQILDNKYDWLARCSVLNNLITNLDARFEENQLFLIAKEAIPNGARLLTNGTILAKVMPMEDSQSKSDAKLISLTTSDSVKVKDEPVESEEQPKSNQYTIMNQSLSPLTPTIPSKTKEMKKIHNINFNCDDCGIRFSSRSTLDAHQSHYCIKRDTSPMILSASPTIKNHSTDATVPSKIKSIKRKHTDANDSPISPNKRLSLASTDSYCSECDILFSKPSNLIQHKLHYCGIKSSNNACSSSAHQSIEQNLNNVVRPPIPFDRPIQIGQFIYVPVPIVPSSLDQKNRVLPVNNADIDINQTNNTRPLDLSKPKKVIDEPEENLSISSSPLDLSVEKPTNSIPFLNPTTLKPKNIVLAQIYECDYCSIRFSSLKTLHAHQENYCIEYRRQRKNNSINPIINQSTGQSKMTSSEIDPSPSVNLLSKPMIISPNDASNSSQVPPHRSSPFMCRLCKYRGNTLRGMRMHFKFHLSNNEPCSDDDIIVTTNSNQPSSISPLSTTAVQILLKCTICSAMFDHEEMLFNHIKCVHTKENLLECIECQSRFCSKWNLLRHMKLRHTNIKCEEDGDEQEQNIRIDDHDHDQDQEKKNIESLINEHVEEMDTNHSLSNSNRSSQKDSSDEEQEFLNGKETLSDAVNLTRHVLIESMDINSSKTISNELSVRKKFACPYCHIKFGSIDTLKQHMTNYCSSRPSNDDPGHHSKKKSTSSSTNDTYCSSCQIPFRHKSSYEAHKMYYCRASQKAHIKIQV